jgi:hypothetical protein
MSNDSDEEDKRIILISTYVTHSLKLKLDRWTKFYVSTDENKNIILNFLNKNTINCIFFSTNQNNSLVLSLSYNCKNNYKTCYFAKQKPNEPIELNKNPQDQLYYGDISYNIFEQFLIILDNVILINFNTEHYY